MTDENRETRTARDADSDRQVEGDIRSVRRGAWRFVTLGIAAIALLAALIVSMTKPRPASITAIVEEPTGPAVRIVDASWTVDGQGVYTIAGRIENRSGGPIRVVGIEVLFYDETHALAGTKTSTIDLPEPVPPGGHHPFSVSGPHDARYKAADYRVESWN
ncbi:MAG: FxLYD domain-containing protein [Deltaproteobacteria bacterium]|nr:FxLYD domain-containing protein [Deltaproteobacteria bacterium]